VAAEGYIGDARVYAIIIEVELEDVSNSNTTNTIDNNVEFVGKFGLWSQGACLCNTVEGAAAIIV
jgi:hypothetical protein